MILISTLLGLVFDQILGEPKRMHPLVLFGRWVGWVEQRCHHADSPWQRLRGAVALLGVVAPVVVGFALIAQSLQMSWILSTGFAALMLWLAVGRRSLHEHARAVITPLQQGDLPAARAAVAMLVSRDTAALSASSAAGATTESVLENGADAVFAALFWFWLFGVPGVVLYRLVNTLDAMWGYRTERYIHFGWAAARLDDVMNWIPARLTTLAYILMAGSWRRMRQAAQCAWQQGRRWKSPNAGPVMAAGAGALGVTLGGGAFYHGQWQQRSILGPAGAEPEVQHIEVALRLMDRALVLWLVVFLMILVWWSW
jgi:adenosylcobinamide-phosphate synthase